MGLKFKVWDGENIISINEALRNELVGFQTYGEDGCLDEFFAGVEILQYTGSVDKNEKEIYRGYILKAYKHNEEEFVNQVIFRKGCFWFGNWNWIEFICKFRRIEVIGNIYENKEMMEGFRL